MNTELEKILPLLTKPGRYVGGELNSVRKDPAKAEVKVVLAYPDVYEIGMSNLGLRILYHILNSRPEVMCERVFSPWVDGEELMRTRHLPLLSLESHTPISDFDIVGISLQYELTYTNVLNMLDLGGIPLHSWERKEEDPLVIGGGACALNPEPLADFFDCFCIGEGEEVVLEVVEVVKRCKKDGLRRSQILGELSDLQGVYVPSLNAGEKTVERRWLRELTEDGFPSSPIVPFLPMTHDRLTIELMRGCTRGCRFCQAGTMYRPVRGRSPDSVLNLVAKGLRNTGWEELSLLSLSATDYPGLEELVAKLNSLLRGKRVAISLPSLRGDCLTPRLLHLLKEVKKGALTLAPEAGTQRLRRVLNKDITEDSFLSGCELAFQSGWRHMKLYFMIGLPTERSEDLQGIVDLTRKVANIARSGQVKVSISPFVPRPHTPFQWEAQEDMAELRQKQDFLKKSLRRRNIKIKWRNPKVSYLEGVLSRGARSLSKVVEEAWRAGCRLDEWSEQFRFDLWERSFEKAGIDPEAYLERGRIGEPLPWAHISSGVSEEFLLEDRQKSLKEEIVQDCRIAGCLRCGVCGDFIEHLLPLEPAGRPLPPSLPYGRTRRRTPLRGLVSERKFRVKFAKGEEVRFISHLDLTRAILRGVRRAGIPVSYTQGFTPRPRVSFCPPLSLGFTSSSEFFDIPLEGAYRGDLRTALNQVLPQGIEVLEVKPILPSVRSLSQTINLATYRISPLSIPQIALSQFLDRSSIVVVREVKEGGVREVDIRPSVLDMTERNGSLEVSLRIGGRGRPKLREVLRELTDFEEEEFLNLKVERTGLFVMKGKDLISPLDYNL